MFSFKIALFFVGYLAISNVYAVELDKAAKETLQHELEILEKCAKAGKISDEIASGIFSNYALPDTRDTRCFASCHLLGTKMMNSDGTINWDKVDEIHNSEYRLMKDDAAKALEASKACKNSVVKSPDNCDTAYAAFKCFLDNAKKVNLHMLTDKDL